MRRRSERVRRFTTPIRTRDSTESHVPSLYPARSSYLRVVLQVSNLGDISTSITRTKQRTRYTARQMTGSGNFSSLTMSSALYSLYRNRCVLLVRALQSKPSHMPQNSLATHKELMQSGLKYAHYRLLFAFLSLYNICKLGTVNLASSSYEKFQSPWWYSHPSSLRY
jgi:hypothetical protein